MPTSAIRGYDDDDDDVDNGDDVDDDDEEGEEDKEEDDDDKLTYNNLQLTWNLLRTTSAYMYLFSFRLQSSTVTETSKETCEKQQQQQKYH